MNGPLRSLDQWDDAVRDRYDPNRKAEDFRSYSESTPPVVREFYRLNRANQTHEFAVGKKKEYGALNRGKRGIWEMAEYLNTLVDDSDPDTDLSQIEHNLQTAEAIRADGHPRWFVLAGFIHDLGKVLCLYGEPQWAVVGDTFPTGCAWSGRIVFHEFFAENPDRDAPAYQTRFGIYEEGAGLDSVAMSWGHDEYIYMATKDYLPEPAQYMLRYHSCYPIHKEGAYGYLMNDKDREMMEWVRQFNEYDLYSKSHTRPDPVALRPFYEDLISEYFPEKIDW